jgi:cbb3-type cytochrome oxidase maturation protein
MTALAWLLPAALSLGLLALAGFVWALKSGQFDDLDGAAWRALEDEPGATPLGSLDQTKDGTSSGSALK